MDQRFPLHASIPSHQHTDSFGDSSSAFPLPVPIENPSPSLSPRSQSPIAPLPSPTGSYSPQFESSVHHTEPNHHVLLPPTIPTIENSMPLTNPLPFQHIHRNQVPVDGEYPTAMPAQNDDAILPAPPPYSRYATGSAAQKPNSDSQRPQLELIDVSAAVRALPTVHIAVASNGNVTSTSGFEQTGNPESPASVPFRLQHSDSELSMQSAQSTGSNGLLMGGVVNEKKKKKEKARDNKRVCGIKLWWILLGTAFISILLSIVLGVTLGMVLKQQKRKDDPPQSDSYDLGFPRGDLLVPLKLVGQSRTCLADSSTLPGLVGPIEKVLWSCDIPRHQLHFDIKPKDSGWSSFPPALPAQQGMAEEAEVVISSIGGNPNPKGSIMPQQALYEGIQPPTFFHQPLYRVLDIGDSTKNKHSKKKRGSEGSSPKYSFRVLYTKKIVLRLITITRLLSNPEYLDGRALDMALDSSEIGSAEVVWSCDWDKTYLEGRVWMEGTDQAGFRMVLDEKRPTSFELEQLFPGSNTADDEKGKIACKQKISTGRGILEDLAVGNTGSDVNLSAEINTAKQISERGERKIVEEVVRDTFERGRRRTRKRSSEVSYPTEGNGACYCSWIAN